MKNLKIVEGVASVYFYHVSKTGKTAEPSLCGEVKVMHTSIPITAWGCKSHINERWCQKCGDIMKKEGNHDSSRT